MSVIIVVPPGVERGKSYVQNLRNYWGKEGLLTFPFEHLGAMSLKASLSSAGIASHVVNGMLEEHKDIRKTFHSIKDVARTVGPPELIGLSAMVAYEESERLAKLCRRQWPNAVIALGNNFATLNDAEILARTSVFDCVVRGDGEITFTSLADACLNNRDWREVGGITYINSQGNIHRRPAEQLDIETLPWVSRDELPLALKMGFSASLFSKRGCPYRCTFCGTASVSGLNGNVRYRVRKPEAVVDEMIMLMRDFSPSHITIVDDLFVSNSPASRNWAYEFAVDLQRRGASVPFMIDTRGDFVDKELFDELYKAGLRTVYIGFESGSGKTLQEVFDKRFKSGTDCRRQLEDLEGIGIRVIPGMIMFHPYVEAAELRESITLVDRVGGNNPNILKDRYRAYAGTELYKRLEQDKLLDGDWPSRNWLFKDPNATLLYEKVRDFIDKPNCSYSAAFKFFEQQLSLWEAGEIPYIRKPTV